MVFALIRLVGISNPPLETGHNWRQSLTNMIARNFTEEGADLRYPKIDMAGEKTGIIGSEFPFFNYLIHLVASVFGYEHWYGRLVNLIVSSIGIYYFYKIIKRLFDREVAFNATIVLSASIWFAFSRKIMPDTFSVSLLFIGFYHGIEYLKNGKTKSLIFAFILATLGVLCKIPALSFYSLILLPLLNRKTDPSRKLGLLLTSIVSFAVISSWYFYWVPHLLETYRYQLYAPRSIGEGILEIIPLWREGLEKFYFSSLHSYLALTLTLIGAYILIKKGDPALKLALALFTITFLFFIAKTGEIFPLHNYYIIPFTPIMALMAGKGIQSLKRPPLQVVILLLIVTEGIANQQHDFRIKDQELYKLELEQTADEIIPNDALVIVNGGPNPQMMYFVHRKGWSLTNEEISKPNTLDSLKTLGASFLYLDQKMGLPDKLPEEPVLKTQDVRIYEL